MAYTVIVSQCHRAEVEECEDWEEVVTRCKECKQVCETEEVCEFCLGTGKIEGTDSDGFPSGKFRKCEECTDSYDPDANN